LKERSELPWHALQRGPARRDPPLVKEWRVSIYAVAQCSTVPPCRLRPVVGGSPLSGCDRLRGRNRPARVPLTGVQPVAGGLDFYPGSFSDPNDWKTLRDPGMNLAWCAIRGCGKGFYRHQAFEQPGANRLDRRRPTALVYFATGHGKHPEVDIGRSIKPIRLVKNGGVLANPPWRVLCRGSRTP
jgi:hypothetical protein